MRILLVSTSYPISADGSEAAGAFVADFAAELACQDEVCVVAPGSSDAESEESGVLVRRFAVPRLPLSLLNSINPVHWPPIATTVSRGRRTVIDMARRFGADHLLALWSLPSGWWCRCAGSRIGVPYSTWALGSDIWTLGRVPVVRGVLRQVLRHAQHRFADGLELARDVERISGRGSVFLPSVRKLAVPRGRRWSEAPPYRLAFLGRWHPNKGIDLLLDALDLLSDDDWKRVAEVRICGGGPLETRVRVACARLRQAGRPVVDGEFLGTQQAMELYSWADYLIVPSRIESIPVIFSDAIQAAVPLIATPVGDLPRLFRRFEVGHLATGVTPDSLRQAIGAALRSVPASFVAELIRGRAEFSVVGSVARFRETLSGG